MKQDKGSQTGVTLYALLADLSNQAAWNRFVDRYTPRIYAWCRERGLQDADARNVTQDVLCKLFRSLDTYEAGRGAFRTWLRTVVTNAWRDFLRSQLRARAHGVGNTGVQALLESVGVEEDLASAMDEEFRRELLDTAMERVRDRVRKVTWKAFRLTALEGWSAEDAAAHLELTVSAVYMARHRVQTMLRDEIESLEGATPLRRASS